MPSGYGHTDETLLGITESLKMQDGKMEEQTRTKAGKVGLKILH